MTAQHLITKLQGAQMPSRELDKEIALLVGWRRRTASAELPEFTSSADAAYGFLSQMLPESVGGFSWSQDAVSGVGTARVMSGPYCHGSTVAIAICAAVLAFIEARITEN